MIHTTKRTPAVVVALLMMGLLAPGQTQSRKSTFSIEGYPAEVPLVRLQGRSFVDVQELARITNGSLSFDGDRTILTLPRCDASKMAGDDAPKTGFSRPFMRAAIEAMASIREWGGMLMITVQNGYPVGNNMAGNTIMAYQGRAAENVALASSAASTDADQRGLELLRNEFDNVKDWADSFAQARTSMSATNMTISENALQNDQGAQKVIRCGQFLAQTFASGSFGDDAACH